MGRPCWPNCPDLSNVPAMFSQSTASQIFVGIVSDYSLATLTVIQMDTYRSVLEVLKFTALSNVLQLSCLSSLWHHCAESEELYQSMCAALQVDFQITHLSPKAALRAHFQNRTTLVSISQSQIIVRIKSSRSSIPHQTIDLAPFHLAVDYTTSYSLLPDGSLICCGGKQSRAPFSSFSK